MKLAAGVAPVQRMLKEGVLLGLGTDGAASNNDLNMWEEMDTVAKLHKVFTGDPKVISAQQAFELATIGGAQALHLDKEISSLEKGKRADLLTRLNAGIASIRADGTWQQINEHWRRK